jgi:hypothetical protein
VGKPEGKRPLGIPRHRWVNNIKIDFGMIGWGDMVWIGLALGSIKCCETIDWLHNWWSLE